MNKNQILIVGGSSGLGLHLTNLYLKKKYKVTTISRNINTKINIFTRDQINSSKKWKTLEDKYGEITTKVKR